MRNCIEATQTSGTSTVDLSSERYVFAMGPLFLILDDYLLGAPDDKDTSNDTTFF